MQYNDGNDCQDSSADIESSQIQLYSKSNILQKSSQRSQRVKTVQEIQLSSSLQDVSGEHEGDADMDMDIDLVLARSESKSILINKLEEETSVHDSDQKITLDLIYQSKEMAKMQQNELKVSEPDRKFVAFKLKTKKANTAMCTNRKNIQDRNKTNTSLFRKLMQLTKDDSLMQMRQQLEEREKIVFRKQYAHQTPVLYCANPSLFRDRSFNETTRAINRQNTLAKSSM